jgi:tetratricopeptide (TPR) repeat protein
MNVLPLVNKGLALFQWKQDVEAAERCCNEALRTDPECEAAVATLAQLSLHQGKIDVAVRMFERHTELARNEPELVNALTYQYVSKNALIVTSALIMATIIGIICSTQVYQGLPRPCRATRPGGAHAGVRTE